MTDVEPSNENVRKNFHQTLEEIRQEMVQMSALVTEGIPRATETLLSGNLTEAQQIIDDDDPLDARAVELEETCYQVLALQQPMASDLRGIVTAIRMIAEIERSGDLVVNIAKGARRIFGTEIPARLRGLIGQMGDLAAQADLVVTTGGISVGEEDHVSPAVLALGGEIWVNVVLSALSLLHVKTNQKVAIATISIPAKLID